MTRTATRPDCESSDLASVRQEALEARNKAESVQQQIGEMQNQFQGMQSQMNRIELLLQGLSGTHLQPGRNEDAARIPADLLTTDEIELEVLRRAKNHNQIQVNSTQGVNFNGNHEANPNHPPTGHSAELMNWGQNVSQPATPVSLAANNRNQFREPNYGRQWNPDPNTERVNNFYKTIARGPNIEFPRFDGNQPLEWIRQIEIYFAMANVPDEAKLDLAQMYMGGRADTGLEAQDYYGILPLGQSFARWCVTGLLNSVAMRFWRTSIR